MKRYLILMYSNNESPNKEASKQNIEAFKSWGKYLNQFSEDENYLGGCQLTKTWYVIAKGNSSSQQQYSHMLKGYMMISASNIEQLKLRLKGNPILDNCDGLIQILEMDPTAIIGKR